MPNGYAFRHSQFGSSLSAPRGLGASLTDVGVLDILIGEPTIRVGPMVECSTVVTISRSASSGASIT